MNFRSVQTVFLGLLLVSASVASPALAKPKTFYIGDGKDVVSFSSDAPVELITGSTPKIDGTVTYDDAFKFDAKHPFQINFDVDLTTLDTGIPLRNDHMRDNFLETKLYPKATFKVTDIQTSAKPPFKSGQVVNLKATGLLTVHGKSVKKTVPLKVTYFPESELTKKRFKGGGNMIRIQGTFPVKLEEHGIKRPEMVFQKLAETVYVTVDAFGTDNASAVK